MFKSLLRKIVLAFMVGVMALSIPAYAEMVDEDSHIMHVESGNTGCFKVQENNITLNKDMYKLKNELISENKLKDVVTQIDEIGEKRSKTVYMFSSLKKLDDTYVPTESIIYSTDNKQWFDETVENLTKEIKNPYILKDVSEEFPSGKSTIHRAVFQRKIKKSF